MQVVCFFHVVHQAAEIIFGHGPVHIANEEPIVFAVQVDFGPDGPVVGLDLEANCIPSISERQFFQNLLGRLHWLCIAILVK